MITKIRNSFCRTSLNCKRVDKSKRMLINQIKCICWEVDYNILYFFAI